MQSIIHHMHDKYPQAPLFAIGTSSGANILVLVEHFVLSLASFYSNHVLMNVCDSCFLNTKLGN